MPSHTRSLAVIALVCLLVLAGCSGGGGGGDGVDGGENLAKRASGGGSGAATGGDRPVAKSAQTGNAHALQRQRALIKTGHIRLEVENVTQTQQRLSTATRRLGGYVGASSVQTRTENGQNITTGKLVLRVPSQNFSTLYDRVKAAGTVLSARMNTTDVTDQLIDLKARLESLRAQRKRLRNLYANASDIDAILKIQNASRTFNRKLNA